MKIKFSFFIIALLSLSVFYSCGKKDDSTKTGDSKENTSDSKTSGGEISADKPIEVEFKIAGTMQGTVKAIYFKNKARSQSHIELGGQHMTATAYFTGGDTMYIVSEIAGMKQGMKINKGDYGKKEGEIDALTFKDQLNKMDKVGTEEVLGKTCDIYKSKDGKYQMSIYKEMVPLKISSGDGKMVMEATKLNTDAKVDDNTFNPPTDVKYMDAGNMMKDLKNPKDIDNLKEKTKEYEDMMKKYKK